MSNELRAAWNQVAGHYQRRHAIPTDSAHYGPWAPPENELRLLGDVRGQRILEVGCGGGQCSIAFARQGASVVGVDLSDAQLVIARQLAAKAGVAVEFVRGSAERLDQFADSAWDIVFSTYTFQYVADMPQALRECARVLTTHGRLVFSLDHPLHACFFDAEEQEMTPYPARSYFDHRPLTWQFTDTGVWMHSYHRTVAEWIDLLHAAGFRLRRLLEPQPPADMLDELWPPDDPRAALRHIPPTIIFVADKGG